MNIIGLLDHSWQGSYSLHNQNINLCNDRQLSRLRNQTFGFIFQSFILLPRLTILENVLLPLTYRDIKSEAAEEKSNKILDTLNLQNAANKFPHQLSGGQQQRVAIARAIVGDPKMLLADEPTGSLDAKNTQAVMEILLQLNSLFHTTVLMVTHDLQLAQQYQRILRIEEGQLIE